MLFDTDNQSPAAPALSRREKDENYDDVVVVLSERWRIIWCSDHYHWIIQQRDKSTKTLATPRWRGRKYHRKRDDLFVALASLKIDPSPDAVAIIMALPEWSDRPEVVS